MASPIIIIARMVETSTKDRPMISLLETGKGKSCDEVKPQGGDSRILLSFSTLNRDLFKPLYWGA